MVDFVKGDGLVPAIVQDGASGEVLMLGYMNAAALEATLASGDTTFYSRSRDRLWVKGEQSGHTLRVREVLVDCDADTVLVKVDALGPGACHEGYRSCFYRRLDASGSARTVAQRAFDPERVYGRGAAR
ncbi:MAG TPA: phosphoribosyl-AMP cyclohydrolase [Gemmatimonadales bacterium]|nr:phosphoribosyl-AMP cyclohydrolase [Gemmatimonadales bacterium]